MECVLSMKKNLFVGLFCALLLLIVISPVAAYEPKGEITLVTMICDPICLEQEFECTVTMVYEAGPAPAVETVGVAVLADILDEDHPDEDGMVITYASNDGIITSELGGSVAAWIFPDVQQSFTATRTIRMKTSTAIDYQYFYGFIHGYAAQGTTTRQDGDWQYIFSENWGLFDVSDSCNYVPEFPSAFLPVTFIIGFLGAVLLIQRTRET
jgi:hypothetical protein